DWNYRTWKTRRPGDLRLQGSPRTGLFLRRRAYHRRDRPRPGCFQEIRSRWVKSSNRACRNLISRLSLRVLRRPRIAGIVRLSSAAHRLPYPVPLQQPPEVRPYVLSRLPLFIGFPHTLLFHAREFVVHLLSVWWRFLLRQPPA